MKSVYAAGIKTLMAANARSITRCRLWRRCQAAVLALLCIPLLGAIPAGQIPEGGEAAPVVIMTIKGAINPAADDYLKSTVQYAASRGARLVVINLDTPGGLLTSMQSMVETLLESPVPTVVYVSPSGAGATSAGVFITYAGNFAAMAPATTIGAAHPVLGTGGDVEGKMGEKVENMTASLIRTISERRGRNSKWAEQAVRESVSVTDSEALQQKIIDFVAPNLEALLEQLEGKTVKIGDEERKLRGLLSAPRQVREMSFKQQVVNVLSDPNIAILLGLGAMLGIGIELYHPGAIFPGVFGAICLVLSLTAAQVLPISIGGVALLLLSAVFFTVEMFMPSFGIWGAAGVVCLVLGSIYFIDAGEVWGQGIAVNRGFIGGTAATVGGVLLLVIYLALTAMTRRITTGKEGMAGKTATVKIPFAPNEAGGCYGKVEVMGEYWKARCDSVQELALGTRVRVLAVEDGLQLLVKPLQGEEQQ